MNILLVEPRTPDTFWSLRHALPFVGKRAANPPLGLLTLAGLLPDDWNDRVVDQNVRNLHDHEIAWADWVLVSAMVVHRDAVADLVARCRRVGKPLIGGGPLFLSETDRSLGVEHVVVGEAEDVAADLVADMRRGEVRALYQAPDFPDLARTPSPRWDLVDLDDYATLSVQSCRGCPFDCEFCDVTALNGRKPRYKSAAQFIAELETLRTRGWQGQVFVVDDNFIGNKRRARELLHAVIAWRRRTGARMVFITEASVDMAADPILLDLMAKAGFKKVFLGLETPSLESLRECRKLQNLRGDLAESVRTIQQAGLEVMGGFIVGFDSDEKDIFQRQFEFIQDTGVVTAMVGLLQALPRSRLYQRLAHEGRLLARSAGNNTDAVFNFEPRLDRAYLEDSYRKLMRQLYEPGVYYRRIRTFLETYDPRGPRTPVSRADIAALLRSLWVMGVVDRGRLAYWRFMAGTLIKHPHKIGVAVTLSIMGHHFRRVAAGL